MGADYRGFVRRQGDQDRPVPVNIVAEPPPRPDMKTPPPSGRILLHEIAHSAFPFTAEHLRNEVLAASERHGRSLLDTLTRGGMVLPHLRQPALEALRAPVTFLLADPRHARDWGNLNMALHDLVGDLGLRTTADPTNAAASYAVMAVHRALYVDARNAGRIAEATRAWGDFRQIELRLEDETIANFVGACGELVPPRGRINPLPSRDSILCERLIESAARAVLDREAGLDHEAGPGARMPGQPDAAPDEHDGLPAPGR
jgi:hypothetical protein